MVILMGYVRAVMLNQARTQGRRRARRPEVIVGELPEPVASHDGERQVDHRIDLGNVLKQLSPRQRAVIYLRYCEDLSVAETASLMDCSPGTVKRQSFDASITSDTNRRSDRTDMPSLRATTSSVSPPARSRRT
jgi:RNA polymerase sigma factor (sigma-70 family)